MLSLMFMTRQKKRTLEETVKLIQQGDLDLLNETIEAYKPFIAKTVSSVCKRYIYDTDDEFSIGLIAFHEAINKYSTERGSSLLSFAEIIIKRRVIDYIRKQNRNQHISMGIGNELQDDGSPNTAIFNDLSLEDFQRKTDEERRKEEIVHFQNLLTTFDLSFSELIEHSPKHSDARKNAMISAKKLVEDEELLGILLQKKRLPIKLLEKKVNVSRKTIERNRKYIIAMTLILSSDYVYMKDYLKGVLES